MKRRNNKEIIYDLIRDTPMSAKQIVKELNISESTVHKHCKVLVDEKRINFSIRFWKNNYCHPYSLYGGKYKEARDDV